MVGYIFFQNAFRLVFGKNPKQIKVSDFLWFFGEDCGAHFGGRLLPWPTRTGIAGENARPPVMASAKAVRRCELVGLSL